MRWSAVLLHRKVRDARLPLHRDPAEKALAPGAGHRACTAPAFDRYRAGLAGLALLSSMLSNTSSTPKLTN